MCGQLWFHSLGDNDDPHIPRLQLLATQSRWREDNLAPESESAGRSISLFMLQWSLETNSCYGDHHSLVPVTSTVDTAVRAPGN